MKSTSAEKPLNHHLRVEGADLVQLVAPMFDFDPTTPVIDLPDYLIRGRRHRARVTSASWAARPSWRAAGGATGGALLPRIGAKKGLCDRPKALMINGLPLGSPAIIGVAGHFA